MNRRRLLGVMAALGSSGFLAACTSAAEKPQNSATAWNAGRLAIGTGGTSGVYYQFGGALADAINDSLPGAVATAQPTSASADNIRRIVRGDAALGLSGDGVPVDAVSGVGAFQDQKQSILALASLFPGVLHLVVRSDLGINRATGAPKAKVTSVEALEGLRVSRGGLGSGDDLFSKRVLQTAGLDVEKDIKSFNMSLNDAIKKLKQPVTDADAIDAVFASSGIPNAPIAGLVKGGGYHLVPCGTIADKMANDFGGYQQTLIPGGEYGSPDTSAVQAPTLLLVSTAMPEQLAYDITKAFFDHQAKIGELLAPVKDITKMSAANTKPVALHPGAERYFRENPG